MRCKLNPTPPPSLIIPQQSGQVKQRCLYKNNPHKSSLSSTAIVHKGSHHCVTSAHEFVKSPPFSSKSGLFMGSANVTAGDDVVLCGWGRKSRRPSYPLVLDEFRKTRGGMFCCYFLNEFSGSKFSLGCASSWSVVRTFISDMAV